MKLVNRLAGVPGQERGIGCLAGRLRNPEAPHLLSQPLPTALWLLSGKSQGWRSWKEAPIPNNTPLGHRVEVWGVGHPLTSLQQAGLFAAGILDENSTWNYFRSFIGNLLHGSQ